MTKAMMFSAIANYFATSTIEAIPNLSSGDEEAISTAEIVDFCAHELELLARKSNSLRKPTAKQVENEGYLDVILTILRENKTLMTISEVAEDERLNGIAKQRVSALMTKLKNEQKVVRTEDKRKAYFSIME